MINIATEKILSTVTMVGSAFITIFILWGSVTDPVNVTKLLGLGGLAGALTAILTIFGLKKIWSEYKLQLLLLILFLLAMINSVVQSKAPTVQLIYGVYGRNSGLVTYVFLTLIFLASMLFSLNESFLKIIYALMFAGTINVFYTFWVTLFGDFVGWTNPYGNVLGTFGNPNFVGSYLGISVSIFFAYAIRPQTTMRYRAITLLLIVIGWVEIRESSAIQGIVVGAGGMALVLFLYLRSRCQTVFIPLIYSFIVSGLGIAAVLGALQKGPLSPLIYKNSVSLRGEYWQAAINMGREFPFSGVGMDTYGDWYRELREPTALINPGPETTTNAAHNVFLDQFAYGGWPMFITYLLLVMMVLISIIKIFLRTKEYDFIFAGLSVAWICYQIQSLISINQIGLASWGWILGGALIAYERSGRPIEKDKVSTANSDLRNKGKAGQKVSVVSPQMVAGVGLILGLLVGTPPLSADMTWKSAATSGSLEQVEKALIPGYLNPLSSARYISAVQLFETSELYDYAYRYAKVGVDFNPNSFDSWKLLYYIKNSNEADKVQALSNMRRLDPNNPEILNLSE